MAKWSLSIPKSHGPEAKTKTQVLGNEGKKKPDAKKEKEPRKKKSDFKPYSRGRIGAATGKRGGCLGSPSFEKKGKTIDEKKNGGQGSKWGD